MTVYPRWRGEHPAGMCRVQLDAGLSPLARGTQTLPGVLVFQLRFIPAGAGNTQLAAENVALKAVYPRWRGEHSIISCARSSIHGLSPLARGTLRDRAQYRGDERFIPAGAGNTFLPASMRVLNSVYPRWRGEHLDIKDCSTPDAGLSPLARGTLLGDDERQFRGRFIPAGAGNTVVEPHSARAAAVYPRWRGEHGTC